MSDPTHVLVPVEPTEEMITYGIVALSGNRNVCISDLQLELAYRAMVDMRPRDITLTDLASPPPAASEPIEARLNAATPEWVLRGTADHIEARLAQGRGPLPFGDPLVRKTLEFVIELLRQRAKHATLKQEAAPIAPAKPARRVRHEQFSNGPNWLGDGGALGAYGRPRFMDWANSKCDTVCDRWLWYFAHRVCYAIF